MPVVEDVKKVVEKMTGWSRLSGDELTGLVQLAGGGFFSVLPIVRQMGAGARASGGSVAIQRPG
jgi:hypothetical protein